MSYIDDYYAAGASKNKIPYDDIPITRERENKRTRRVSQKPRQFLGFFTLLLFIFNIILGATSIYYAKHSKTKVVNYYNNNFSSTGEVSSVVPGSVTWNSVCVAAGGTCTSEPTFYNNTLSRGAGVIYKADYDTNTIYFITCYHVVSGYSNKIWVMLPSQSVPMSASLVSYTSDFDIAVLKLTASDIADILDGCTPVECIDTTYVSPGDKVYAVGNPLSTGFTITEGIISKVNTMVTISGNAKQLREFQTSAAINPGNSGGGLYSADGKFIGIVNAKQNTTKSSSETIAVSGFAYAIPGNMVRGLGDRIIESGSKPSRIDIGVTFAADAELGKTKNYVEYNGQVKEIVSTYVYVKSVESGALASGLKTGDYIDSIEFYVIEDELQVKKKVKMYNEYVFEDYSYLIEKGTEIIFTVVSGSTTKTVSVSATRTKTVDN